MKTTTTTNNAAHVARDLGPVLAALLAFIERHPRAAAVLLWLQAAALAWAVFTYDFTTNF